VIDGAWRLPTTATTRHPSGCRRTVDRRLVEPHRRAVADRAVSRFAILRGAAGGPPDHRASGSSDYDAIWSDG
jgi:hypothetical protein